MKYRGKPNRLRSHWSRAQYEEAIARLEAEKRSMRLALQYNLETIRILAERLPPPKETR